jgi:hypothetical protein
MNKIIASGLLIIGVAGQAFAGNNVPEIGASTAAGAITLVSGAILVLRSRRRK